MKPSTAQIGRRRLGALEVSALGLGCMPLSGMYGAASEAESIATIHRAIDLGIDLFDTADAYGLGHNEELLGRAVRDRRDRVVVATKFGTVRNPDGTVRGLDGRPAYVRAACEASLRRLGLEVIDLLFLHRVDPATPIEDTIGEMARLVEDGKVRHLGVSEASRSLRRAHAVHPLAAVETEYSLWSRELEREVLPVCRELGIGIVAYSPLGRGFLTGAVQAVPSGDGFDLRRGSPRFERDNLAHNRPVVEALAELAARIGSSASQLALAWVLARGADVVPIFGTRRISHLEHNLGALDVRLDGQTLAALDALFGSGAVAGERYAPALMAALDG